MSSKQDQLTPKTLELLSLALEALKPGKRGNGFVIPPLEAVSREEYEEFAEVITRCRGKWVTKTGHKFSHDPTPQLKAIIAAGCMPDKNPLAYFPTPSSVVDDLLETVLRTGAWKLERVLEPSAGQGAFVQAVANRLSPSKIVAIELDSINVAALKALELESLEVHQLDFLSYKPDAPFNLILMNPPFAVEDDRDAWLTHFEHARSMLSDHPGARIGCIAPWGAWTTSTRSKWIDFRRFLERSGAIVYKNEAGAFKESGTMVVTCSIILDNDPMTAERSADYAWLLLINTFELYTKLRELIPRSQQIVRERLEIMTRELWWSEPEVECGGWVLNDQVLDLLVLEFNSWKVEESL